MHFNVRAFSVSSTTVLALAAGLLLLPGCGGGGGGGTGGLPMAGVLTPATSYSKAIRMQFKTVDPTSAVAEVVSTPPSVADIRSIQLTLHAGITPESAVEQQRSAAVPPFNGEIIVSNVTPGEHLIEVVATTGDGRPVYSGEFVTKFLPGEAAFVDFVGTPVADVNAFNYHGGQLPPEPFTYLMTKAGSPYHITDVIGIPAGVRMIIEPGVTLQFDADGTVDSLGHPHPADMKVEGRLLAVGTADEPIVFTRFASGTASQRPRILFFQDRVTSSDPIQSRVRFATVLNSATGIELQDSDVSISANLFQGVGNGVVAGRNAASRVVGNIISASSTGIYITSAATEVTRNQISGAQYGIALQKASSLVENNEVSNASEAGIWLSSSPLCIVNSNTVRATSIQAHWGIYVRASNALISQNRVERTTQSQSSLLYGGIYVSNCVSGSSNADRLVLDHNTVQRSYLANVVIAGADPVVRFNELADARGGANSSGYGVMVSGVGQILPKQPLFLGNNIRNNAGLAIGPDPSALAGVQEGPSSGGGVLGSVEAGGGNYVADNFGVSGADATVSGTVDQVFDVSTPQIESVDAILSVTTAPMTGSGAPAVSSQTSDSSLVRKAP